MATSCARKQTTTTTMTQPLCACTAHLLQLGAVKAVLGVCDYEQGQVLAVAQRMLGESHRSCQCRSQRSSISSGSWSAGDTDRSPVDTDHLQISDVGKNLSAASLLRELESQFGREGVGVWGDLSGASSREDSGGVCSCPGHQSCFSSLTNSSSGLEDQHPSTLPHEDENGLSEDGPDEEGRGSWHTTARGSSRHNDAKGVSSLGPIAGSHYSKEQAPLSASSSKGTAESTVGEAPTPPPAGCPGGGLAGHLAESAAAFAGCGSSIGNDVSAHVSSDQLRQKPPPETSETRSQRQRLEGAKKKNLMLKARRSCVHCKVRPVNLTLLPCGHFCLCTQCGDRYQRCPVCCKTILADVKTYLA